MMNISKKAAGMPSSAIRKLTPFADAAAKRGVKVYHLNVGAPDIKSPACALQAVETICKGLRHLPYTDSAGLPELRKAMVDKYYRPLGINITTDDLLISIAGTESFSQAIQIVADEGDEILSIEPFYTNYRTFCYEFGVSLVTVHSDIREAFSRPPIEEWEEKVTPRTKAVLLSNPCNPSGELLTREDMIQIGDFCKRHDLFLICDEVYREFCYTDEEHISALQLQGLEDNVIVCDSISKRYNLCGARIGCIISRNKDVMAASLRYAQSRLCPPILGQYAALGALDAGQSYFDEVKAEYIARRDYTISKLNSIPGVFSPCPQGAFYAVASLPVDNAEDFVKWMLTDYTQNGATTMVTPIESFYKTPGCGRDQVRIAYVLGVPELTAALDILESGLALYTDRSR